MHRVIKSKQEALSKPQNDMNTGLRKNIKNNFRKDIFKLVNIEVFRKAMKNVRKHQAFKKQMKKDLFAIKTKQSYNKDFLKKIY